MPKKNNSYSTMKGYLKQVVSEHPHIKGFVGYSSSELHKKQNDFDGIASPFLAMFKYELGLDGEKLNTIGVRKFGFAVMRSDVPTDDFEAQYEAVDECEALALSVLARINYDNNNPKHFLHNSFLKNTAKIKPVELSANSFGVECYFSLRNKQYLGLDFPAPECELPCDTESKTFGQILKEMKRSLDNLKKLIFSGKYEDLENKPKLFSGKYEDLENKPELFSRDYKDLKNKPNIPKISFIENNEGDTTVISQMENPKAGDIIFEKFPNETLRFWFFKNGHFELERSFEREILSTTQDVVSVLDWRYKVGVVTSDEDVTLSFDNLRIGNYFLIVNGDISVIFPENFDYVDGERSNDVSYYQVTCLNAKSPRGIYLVHKKREGLSSDFDEDDIDLKRGLLSGYTFDNIAEGKVIDVCGNSNIVINNAQATSGLKGSALKFYKNNTPSISEQKVIINGDFTISFWIKFNDIGNGKDWHLSLRDVFSFNMRNAIQYFQYSNASFKVTFWDNDKKASVTILIPENKIELNRFYHVITTLDGALLKNYLDGNLISEDVVSGFSESNFLRMGNAAVPNFPTTSSIDELYIWHRALKEQEITHLYNNGSGLTYNEF